MTEDEKKRAANEEARKIIERAKAEKAGEVKLAAQEDALKKAKALKESIKGAESDDKPPKR
jgi:hypothetical protein